MEYITNTVTTKVRYETHNGRRYMIAPLTLIVRGVLSGSQGPLMYRLEDIAANHQAWDGKPLVSFHPIDPLNNAHLSANDEGVLSRQGIGVFRRPQITRDGKLKGEAWFDEERTRRVNKEIYNSLKAGRQLECSSGLYTTNVPAPLGSNHNGVPFTHYATNHIPDHVAILTDGQIGACSLQAGCGVLVNKQHQLVANESTPTQPSSVVSVPAFFTTLLHAATSAHILHLSTNSFAAHTALDTLYKKLPKKVDTLIEVWQGQNSLVKDWPSGFTPPTNNPVAFVQSLCDYLRANRESLGDCTIIQNLIDDIGALLDNTLYKLRNLS